MTTSNVGIITMIARLLVAAVFALGITAPLLAQPSTDVRVNPPKLPDSMEADPSIKQGTGLLDSCPPANPRLWFQADYLMWWVKGAPMPQPLITSGSSSDPIPGALGQPGTSTLYGGQRTNFGLNSGLRLSLGGWLDADQRWGAELSGFSLGRYSRRAAFGSDGTTDASLGQPFVNPNVGEEAYSTSLNGLIAGRIFASTSTQLYGWEANVLRNLARGNGGELDLIVGFRQVGLRENLRVDSDIQQLQPFVLSFAGQPINVGDHILTSDRFRAQTNFYGPQIGGKVTFINDRFGADLIGKLAMGVSQELYTINGSTTLIPAAGGGNSTVPGGILAQTTNIGRHFENRFAVVPEANLNLHYDFTDWARLNFGYTFVYISRVARPGLVVDRTVDPGRVPSDQNFGTGTTTNSPGFQFRDAGYWAQGLNFGLTLRY